MYVAANDNTDNAHNEPSLYPSFEIEFGVSACELKGAATVDASTIAVMMSIFSDIPLD